MKQVELNLDEEVHDWVESPVAEGEGRREGPVSSG